ncbi:MAG: hypothetical protein KGI19_04920 [Thaumarchaeota archaeon]|nr:hypothetical protein [Nitrososphaerota archaeon]
MSFSDKIIGEIMNKLESKKKEADGFVLKYKTRGMADLEEYYKGVSWALDYAIKIIKEPSHENP